MPASLLAPVLVDTLAPPSGPWSRVDVLGRVDSTNAVSLADPVPWRLVAAEQQDAGRGRHSRVWVSPLGTSVSMSMTVPLPPRPEEWGWVPLVTGLAVRDALSGLPGGEGLQASVKWPNDVLVRGRGEEARKVCGILCESADDLVVVGVGINVTVPEVELPVPTATSLHLEGVETSREDVIVAVATAFARRFTAMSHGGPYLAGVRHDYRDACTTIGRDVRLHVPAGDDVLGRVTDVDHDGRLVLDVDGARRVHAAGDVVHVRGLDRA